MKTEIAKTDFGWVVKDTKGQAFEVKNLRKRKVQAIFIASYPFRPATRFVLNAVPAKREASWVSEGVDLAQVIEAAIDKGAFDVEVVTNLP